GVRGRWNTIRRLGISFQRADAPADRAEVGVITMRRRFITKLFDVLQQCAISVRGGQPLRQRLQLIVCGLLSLVRDARALERRTERLAEGEQRMQVGGARMHSRIELHHEGRPVVLVTDRQYDAVDAREYERYIH